MGQPRFLSTLRAAWLGLLAAVSIAPARSAPLPPRDQPSAIERVADIRARLLARDAADGDAQNPAPPVTSAQLNRRNWGNWSNWNNWLKWGKF